jgi:hypothetical protein
MRGRIDLAPSHATNVSASGIANRQTMNSPEPGALRVERQ